MKSLIFTLLLGSVSIAHAQANHLVISQIYGAGGNTGANYIYDYVELYNPTANPVSLSGWSLQYAGATSNNWNSNKVTLSGTVNPGNYFLIQLGNPGTEGKPLPKPDLVSTNISISTAGGKVALISNVTTLVGNCPLPNAAIVDFVGFGSADCSETATATGPVTGNTASSVTRINNGCTETDNNRADFVLMTASPRNSTSNGHTCNGASITIGNVTPNSFCVDAYKGAVGTVGYTANGVFSNSTFNAIMSDANGSFGYSTIIGSAIVSGTNTAGVINIAIPANTVSGTGYKIRIEATDPPLISATQSNAFEIINGAKDLLPNEFFAAANNTTMTLAWTNPSSCFDEILIVAKEGSSINGTPSGDGSAYMADLSFSGSGTPFDGGKVVYKGGTSGQTVTNLTNGITYFFKAYTRRGTSWSSGTEINDKPRVVPLAGEIVIDHVSPQYNGTKDEYIVLVNVTDKALPLSDLTIDIKNTSGANVVAGSTLSGILQPHSYILILPIGKDTATVGQSTGLNADINMDLGFANTNNQIGLIRKTDSTVIDAVGYGTFSNFRYVEGAPAANPPSKGGLRRVMSGTDMNKNNTDFTGVAYSAIELRNSNSRLANAGALISAGNYMTLEVTGNASLSGVASFSDKVVLTNGVFSLNDYGLTTGAVAGGAATRYIKTAGAGSLAITNVNSDVVFPVGNSTYNPVTISNGSALTWRVNVADAITPGATPFNKEYAVQRTWNVTPSALPGVGANLVFEYNDNDPAQLGKSFDKTKHVQVWSYHDGKWEPVTAPQTPVALPSGRKAVTLSNYTQFSAFTIVNVNAALPVHFIDFSVREQNGGVQLQFTNASENDVQQYVIERAADGQLFETIKQVSPLHNDGSTVLYHWFDAKPLPGEAWYRVKGVDKDGTIRYTPVLKINMARASNALTVYPNPVRGRALAWQAKLPEGMYMLRVSNNKGQEVLRQWFKHSDGDYTGTVSLPAGLPSGIYYMQIGNGTLVQRQSFVVY